LLPRGRRRRHAGSSASLLIRGGSVCNARCWKTRLSRSSWHSRDLHSHLLEHAIHLKHATKRSRICHCTTKLFRLHDLSDSGAHLLQLWLGLNQVVNHPWIGQDLAHGLLKTRLQRLDHLRYGDTPGSSFVPFAPAMGEVGYRLGGVRKISVGLYDRDRRVMRLAGVLVLHISHPLNRQMD